MNITSWVARRLRDSLSRDLDLGVLRRQRRAPEPDGVIDQAEAVSGATLIAAAGAAIAAIGEAGGSADTIALSPTAYADELVRSDDHGQLVHPDGLPDLLGLTAVAVAGPGRRRWCTTRSRVLPGGAERRGRGHVPRLALHLDAITCG